MQVEHHTALYLHPAAHSMHHALHMHDPSFRQGPLQSHRNRTNPVEVDSVGAACGTEGQYKAPAAADIELATHTAVALPTPAIRALCPHCIQVNVSTHAGMGHIYAVRAWAL